MLIKLLISLFLLFLTSHFSLLTSAYATSDPLSVPNNRWGIHILETSELSKAAEFVNSGGGDWGYVTIPIRANERDFAKWSTFMTESKRLHLIPILRIATFPKDDHWMAPNEFDLVDFANFLDELPWPVTNRYIVIYNEPNHEGEWGGFVYPEEYARVLDRAIDIFHKKNPDFFVISAGLDASAPNGVNSMNLYSYLSQILNRYPDIFNRVDGFASHAYGNPDFTSPPSIYSLVNIASFRHEQAFLTRYGIKNKPIFITEAGWEIEKIGDPAALNYYRYAFTNIWTDQNIVAVTPFLLSAGSGPFEGFSFISGSEFKNFAQELKKIPKLKGEPEIASSGPTRVTNLEFKPATNTPDLGTSPNNLLLLLGKILSFLGNLK